MNGNGILAETSVGQNWDVDGYSNIGILMLMETTFRGNRGIKYNQMM